MVDIKYKNNITSYEGASKLVSCFAIVISEEKLTLSRAALLLQAKSTVQAVLSDSIADAAAKEVPAASTLRRYDLVERLHDKKVLVYLCFDSG
jgi:hypothetical protein